MRSIVVAEILSSHAAMVVNVLMHGENVMARLTVQIGMSGGCESVYERIFE